MRENIKWIAVITLLAAMVGCGLMGHSHKASPEEMKAKMAKLAPVALTCDLSHLSQGDRKALDLLIKAAKLMDKAFLRQVSKDNEELLAKVERKKPLYNDYFKAMFGPWDRLDEDHPFFGKKNKPVGANFYPEDMTKEEFEQWLADHPEDREAFENTFTVIQRQDNGLKAVPYSLHYQDLLRPAAALLMNAAEAADDATLKTYLKSRAVAFTSNDYYQSDMDWMDLAGDIEVVIGPYEVYEDKLLGYKAAFEAFVCVADPAESKKLSTIKNRLVELEKNLPLADDHKNFNRGSESPVKVANEVFTAGDTKAGVQTLAFNLPNDERVREAKGSKKVLLKNMMQAKYDKILAPIAQEVLTPETCEKVHFDAYFNHVLMHEVSHGLGPGKIRKNGAETTVNKELKTLYSTIEECKADTLGVYNNQYLIDQGFLPKSLQETLYSTYLAGMFRSIRFGIGEAHGGGIAIQLNYLLEKGAFKIDENGLFYVDETQIREAIRSLAAELLIVQAEGDYEGAQKIIDTYCFAGPETQAALDKLGKIPVDVRPSFPLAQ